MQIEEGFRDLKSPRHGLAIRENLGRRPERVAILLLIAALAMFVTWLVGLHAYASGQYRAFMANTETRRKTLSVFLVGKRVLQRGSTLDPGWMTLALTLLRQSVDDPTTQRASATRVATDNSGY